MDYISRIASRIQEHRNPKKIGENLGSFRKAKEFVNPTNFSMVSQICINWDLVHNLPNTIEIKTGLGIWAQKVVLEERMATCSDCNSFAHAKGDCKIRDKGKSKVQDELAEDIIRLLEQKDLEHHWETLDWSVLQYSRMCYEPDLNTITSLCSSKGLIDDLFAAEASTKDPVTLTNTVGSDSVTIQNQYSNPELQSKGMDVVGNIWAPTTGLSAMDLIYSENPKKNVDHTEEEINVSPHIFKLVTWQKRKRL